MWRLSSLPANSRKTAKPGERGQICQPGWQDLQGQGSPGRATSSAPLPSPPGPDCSWELREELLDTVFHGSAGRKAGGAGGSLVHGSHRGLCHPAASAAKLLAFGTPKPSCTNCEQLHGGFTRGLGLLHTLATLKSHPSVVPSGAVGVSCQKSSSRPGTGLTRAEVQVLCKVKPG